jgi:hypothetical protein
MEGYCRRRHNEARAANLEALLVARGTSSNQAIRRSRLMAAAAAILFRLKLEECSLFFSFMYRGHCRLDMGDEMDMILFTGHGYRPHISRPICAVMPPVTGICIIGRFNGPGCPAIGRASVLLISQDSCGRVSRSYHLVSTTVTRTPAIKILDAGVFVTKL